MGVSGNELTLSSPATSDSGSYTCDVTATATSALSAESSGVAINFIGELGQRHTVQLVPAVLVGVVVVVVIAAAVVVVIINAAAAAARRLYYPVHISITLWHIKWIVNDTH